MPGLLPMQRSETILLCGDRMPSGREHGDGEIWGPSAIGALLRFCGPGRRCSLLGERDRWTSLYSRPGGQVRGFLGPCDISGGKYFSATTGGINGAVSPGIEKVMEPK